MTPAPETAASPFGAQRVFPVLVELRARTVECKPDVVTREAWGSTPDPILDARGTPGRSKAFQDANYGRIGQVEPEATVSAGDYH